MYYVYVLKSEKDGNTYIGYTKDLRRRLKEHNTGKSFSTSFRGPFELVYYEAYKSDQDAIHRENNLKLRSRAYAQLRKRIDSSLEK